MMTGKVYEALGLGARVLSIAPRGSDIRTIDESSGMARTFAGSDIDDIASFLINAMRDPDLRRTHRDAYAGQASPQKWIISCGGQRAERWRKAGLGIGA